MTPQMEVLKAYKKNPVDGIEARLMVGDCEGIIFERRNGSCVKVYTSGSVSLSTDPFKNITGTDAVGRLKETDPEMAQVVSATLTDFDILNVRRHGNSSFLFPEIFACNSELVDNLIDKWKQHTGREVYMTNKKKLEFYREFFILSGMDPAEELIVDDITKWFEENNIQTINSGKATLHIENNRIEVAMITNEGDKTKTIPLDEGIVNVKKKLEEALDFITQHFDVK